MSKFTIAVCAAIAMAASGATQQAWAGPKANKGGASDYAPRKGGASDYAPKGSVAAPGKNKNGSKSATGVGQETAPGKLKNN